MLRFGRRSGITTEAVLLQVIVLRLCYSRGTHLFSLYDALLNCDGWS